MYIKIALLCVAVTVCLAGLTAASEVDCRHPPKRVDPRVCCPMPTLITEEIREKCKQYLTPDSKANQPEIAEETQSSAKKNELENVPLATENELVDGEQESPNANENSQTDENHLDDESDEEPNSRPHPHPHPDHHHRHRRHHKHHGHHHRHHHRHHHHRHHHHHHHHYNMHFMNCALNETGIFVNDKLNETNLHAYLTVVLKDTPDMIPVVETSFQTCQARPEDRHTSLEGRYRHHHRFAFRQRRSHAGRGFLMACVHKESFLNCAPSLWNNTQECNDRRTYVQNCRPFGPFWQKNNEDNAGNGVTEKTSTEVTEDNEDDEAHFEEELI